jgi:hypothetical protein
LGKFVTQAKRTPWELYVEIKRMAEEGTHGFTIEDCKMQLKWCLAAGQTADEGKNKPVVQIAMQAVTLDDDAFDDWAFNRLESMLGPVTAATEAAQTIPGTVLPPTQHQDFRGMMESAQAIQQMATAVQHMTEQHMRTNTPTSGNAAGTQQKREVFTIYCLAVLMGWCCITEEEQIPSIWGLILQTKDMEDVRLNIVNAMQQWAEKMKVELNVGLYFPDKMLKALVEMRPTAGGGMATLDAAGKALSIMACMRRTALEIEEIKVKEKAEQDTTSVRTMGEAIVLEGGEKRNPPTTYADLKKTVCTFAGLTFVLYGPACDFYKNFGEYARFCGMRELQKWRISFPAPFVNKLCGQSFRTSVTTSRQGCTRTHSKMTWKSQTSRLPDSPRLFQTSANRNISSGAVFRRRGRQYQLMGQGSLRQLVS